ncbi:DUF1684 domain-containing protein [Deinococcus sp.]|uniref:DUF1684 domain-containing protein n=1 Tax=Deinococcus sp. TaxID=47478 RepID=UPI003C7B9BC0
MTKPTITQDPWLTLLDWRRRVSGLYEKVRLTPDRQAAHENWRRERDDLFGGHLQSPLPPEARADFRGLAHWPYNPELVFEAEVETMPGERFVVQTSAGHDLPLARFGRVRLPFGTLDVYWTEVYGGGVFLPFRDATGGHESYGGGRYLLDTVKGADLGSAADGELTLDFNFAYHPSCFYDHRWSCPLAPPANVLKVKVEAGERSIPL